MRQDLPPAVGLFWAVRNPGGAEVLLSDACPLDEAERYGSCLGFAPGHIEVWARWRVEGSADTAMPASFFRAWEYEDWPRGRVVFDADERRFTVYADRSLLCRPSLTRIADRFRFGACPFRGRADAHYRSLMTIRPRVAERGESAR